MPRHFGALGLFMAWQSKKDYIGKSQIIGCKYCKTDAVVNGCPLNTQKCISCLAWFIAILMPHCSTATHEFIKKFNQQISIICRKSKYSYSPKPTPTLKGRLTWIANFRMQSVLTITVASNITAGLLLLLCYASSLWSQIVHWLLSNMASAITLSFELVEHILTFLCGV